MRSVLCWCRWSLWGYMLYGFFPPVCFFLFFFCTVPFSGILLTFWLLSTLFYRFCLFLSHSMCQNESRAYSLLNSNIPTVTNSSQERSLSLHMALNISELFAFSFVFWLQSRPTVSFVLLRCRWNTHRGKLSAVKWVQCHSRYWSTYLIEPRWHKGLGLVSRRNGLKQAGNTEELQPTTAAKVFLSSSFVLRVIGKFLAPWLTCEQNKNDNNKVFILSYLFVPKKMIFAS